MFVYVIVNDVNLKIYVGKTVTSNLTKYLQSKISDALGRRQRGHSRLFAAIRKCGREHFHIYPLIFGCQTREELSRWEQVLIKALKAQHPDIGYNICGGGEGFTGTHTPETRQKIGAAARAMWRRSDTRQSIVSKMRGRPVSQKAIEALKARRGAKASLETVEKLRISHIGLTRSVESREKQSRSTTGAKNHFYGKHHSEATRAGKWKAVRCVDTGEVFPSAGHVAERFGGSKTNVSRAIRKGCSFQGKRFEYA